MFERKIQLCPVESLPKLVKDTATLYVAVEQYDSKDFNLNDAGWIRNDISQIARAQSIDEYNMIAARLVERKGSSLPDDLSIEDAFDCIVPRYVQSAGEIARYVEATNSTAFNRLQTKSDGLNKPDTAVVEKPAEKVD